MMKHPLRHEIEWRYERREGTYTLRAWAGDSAHPKDTRGFVLEMPEWLATIIAVAKVGGHIQAIAVKPPDEIVWFLTDRDFHLICFDPLEDRCARP